LTNFYYCFTSFNMNNEKIKLVVIIAAGTGSRLKSDNGVPKPLLSLNGRSLILRVLDKFYEAGIKEAIIVTGYRSDEVQNGIISDNHPLQTKFAVNERYTMSNGLSVLAAKDLVNGRNFFLSMADHIFESSLISTLANAHLPENGLVLAVDRKLDEIYDEDDATKVLTNGDLIIDIHKELKKFNAVDTGLFACTPALFTKIEEAASKRTDGDCTLSDGVTAMTRNKQAIVCDIGSGKWQDVDTPGAVTHAEQQFFNDFKK
ncbi:MAG: NTP transferase domain-containing protein, partial [Deltaproteobacteria bacterium]|nr:NTP transferase domain-containing protein [Deltaproteobacteria bacterium]